MLLATCQALQTLQKNVQPLCTGAHLANEGTKQEVVFAMFDEIQPQLTRAKGTVQHVLGVEKSYTDHNGIPMT